MKKLGKLLIMVLMLISCEKQEDEPELFEPPAIPVNIVSGKVKLPGNLMVSCEGFYVISSSESKLNANGTFDAECLTDCFDYIDVWDQNDHFIASAYGHFTDSVLIDEYSTALSLIFKVSLPWEIATGLSRAEMISRVMSHGRYDDLVGYVRNIMSDDPGNLLNFDAHPVIPETIGEILADLIIPAAAREENGAYIADCGISQEEILIKNPKMIPYGISGFDLNGDPSWLGSYFSDKKPVAIPSKGLFGMIPGMESDALYRTGSGDFVVCLGKPDVVLLNAMLWSIGVPAGIDYTFKQAGDLIFKRITSEQGFNYLDIVKMEAMLKGVMANNVEVLILVVGAFPAGGGEASMILDILYNMNNGTETAENLSMSVFEYLTLDKAYNYFIDQILKNPDRQKWLAGMILKDKRKTKIVTSRLKSFLPLIPTFVEGFLKLYDWQTADPLVAYKVHKNGYESDCIKSFPPMIPEVTGCPLTVSFGSPVHITVSADDPEGTNVQYQLLVNPYSVRKSEWIPSGSGWTFTFTPSDMGLYNLVAYAVDEDGAMSGAKRFQMTVVSGNSFFQEGFEGYDAGGFESNAIWEVSYSGPSRVLITNEASEGANAAKFMDYDPAGGNPEGIYAHVVTEIEGKPTSVTFSVMVEQPEDVFGMRTWLVPGDWDYMGYYILVDRGKLKWVKYGWDMDDPSDFVPLMDIEPERWYEITLNIDWDRSTYDILADGIPKVTDATFVQGSPGMVPSAPYFQCVAFVETQCRGGYLDDIYMNGASVKNRIDPGVSGQLKQIGEVTRKR